MRCLNEIEAAAEALLFSLSRPITVKEISTILSITPEEAEKSISSLMDLYNEGRHGIQIVEVAGGYQMVTRPAYAEYLEKAEKGNRTSPLSRPSLETLAIIAYRQPITRAEIEAIRGVKCDGVIATLLDRGLICEAGRKDSIGRPILYGTTPEFLRYFGLRSLEDLPPAQKPEHTSEVLSPPARPSQAKIDSERSGV
ncbi:MAG TPA: SMC-Scp complex subunit ScpB [Firmicutes bacterium]|nr:SMC-Scp complex subunit ScpB [Bacillota bacterium]